jgi:esterase/lipase superfamily enzyme
MAKFWMIANRTVKRDGLGTDHGPLSYWLTDKDLVDQLASWERVSGAQFKKELIRVADQFPCIVDPAQHENQKHVTLFVHGYNNSWDDAARRYRKICQDLFAPNVGLGTCVLFTWPSDGLPADYLPDRADAESSAPELATVLSELYDWLLDQQAAAAKDSTKACKAKTSMIAHSMGNYVLQKAMQAAWTRKNQPLLVSLINQLLMVAADVDNDLFRGGEAVSKSDGDAIANLTYRVTALYSGRDATLGMSAGLKHFGKRRLGRSGLDPNVTPPDNVWAVDCSRFFAADESNIHSAYFDAPGTIDLMKAILRGADRGVISAQFPNAVVPAG